MKYDFLKAAFASVFIFCSAANASVIDVDFTALDEANAVQALTWQNMGSFSVDDDVLNLGSNSWFYIELSDIIGDNSLDFNNTILSFDFLANGIPEIAAISPTAIGGSGLDYQNTFHLLGTQDWGKYEMDYTAIDEWVHFDIDLGKYSQGDNFTRILFINDCDFCSSTNITTSYKNMTITQVPESSVLALFVIGAFGIASRRVKKID